MRTRIIGTEIGKRGVLARTGLVALSALLLSLAFEPARLSPLAWVALAPFLVSLCGLGPFHTRALGFVFGYVFFGVGLGWLFLIFSAAAVGLIAVLAAGLWLFGLVFWLLRSRLGPTAALLLSPIIWVGIDLFRCELWPLRFSWLQLGFSQVPNETILQSVSILGVYGLTLAIVLVNALVALAWREHGPWVGSLAGAAAVLLAVLAGLDWHRVPPADPGPPLRVAALQQELAEPLADARAASAEGPVDLICWPEYALMEYPLDDERLLGEIRQAARETGAVLVIGCKIRAGEAAAKPEEQPFYDAALVVGPDGEVLGSHDKHHPIQFFRDGEAGRDLRPITTPVGRLGVAICYDMTFSHVTRELVRNGAELLVVPALDDLPWGELQRTQHAAMARARAVEHRRWLIRPTTYGVSQIVDPRGYEVARVGATGTAVIRATARPSRALTLHDRGLWLLPYACLGLTAGYLLFEVLARRRGARWRERSVMKDSRARWSIDR